MRTIITAATTDFSNTAITLDNDRLYAQCREAVQILRDNYGLNMRNQVAVIRRPINKNWVGYGIALTEYAVAMSLELTARNVPNEFARAATSATEAAIALRRENLTVIYPTWLLDNKRVARIASGYRRTLLTENYEWYRRFGWIEDTKDLQKKYLESGDLIR